jgi:hypothetical protein
MAEEKEKEKKKKAKVKKPRKKGTAKGPKKAKKVKAKKPKKMPEEGDIEVNVYSIDGKVKGSSVLPEAFHSEIRPDLIQRAVVAFRANRRQRYGPSPTSALNPPGPSEEEGPTRPR